MTQIQVEGAALVAMLASVPLVSWGSTSDLPAVTVVGGLLLAVGLAALTAIRFIGLKEDT